MEAVRYLTCSMKNAGIIVLDCIFKYTWRNKVKSGELFIFLYICHLVVDMITNKLRLWGCDNWVTNYDSVILF